MATIATTHAGNLPRGEELVPRRLGRDHGQDYDWSQFDSALIPAVTAAVDTTIASGSPISCDGGQACTRIGLTAMV